MYQELEKKYKVYSKQKKKKKKLEDNVLSDFAHCCDKLALHCFVTDQFEQAENYYLEAINLQEEITVKEKDTIDCLIDYYINLSYFYEDRKKYNQSVEAFLKATELMKQQKGYALYLAYDRISYLYRLNRKSEKEEEYYLKTAKELEKLIQEEPDTYRLSLSTIYLRIATFHRRKKEYNKSIVYYLKNVKIMEQEYAKSPDMRVFDLIKAYKRLAKNYEYLKEDEKKEEYLQKARLLANKKTVKK